MVYIALGSNLGNRFELLQKAVFRLAQRVGKIESVSRVFVAPAWGFESDPFLNACIQVKTEYTPLELIDILLEIENELGRSRNDTEGYKARSIDLDILLFNNHIINHKRLQIPHPRMELRQFVLTPLADIASEVVHPKLNKNILDIKHKCTDDSVLKLWDKKLKF